MRSKTEIIVFNGRRDNFKGMSLTPWGKVNLCRKVKNEKLARMRTSPSVRTWDQKRPRPGWETGCSFLES